MPNVCITQNSHCPWWVWLRRKTLRSWLVQLASPKLHFVPRGEIKILEPQAQVNVATFLKHPDVRVAVLASALWTALLQMLSRCALNWRGAALPAPMPPLHACVDHSSSSTTAVPAPLISSPPPSTTGFSAPWQHDYLWKVTSPSNFTQKGFQCCRDLQLRGFLLKRRWEQGGEWGGGGGLEKQTKEQK